MSALARRRPLAWRSRVGALWEKRAWLRFSPVRAGRGFLWKSGGEHSRRGAGAVSALARRGRWLGGRDLGLCGKSEPGSGFRRCGAGRGFLWKSGGEHSRRGAGAVSALARRRPLAWRSRVGALWNRASRTPVFAGACWPRFSLEKRRRTFPPRGGRCQRPGLAGPLEFYSAMTVTKRAFTSLPQRWPWGMVGLK